MKSFHALRISAIAAALVLAVPAIHAADTRALPTATVVNVTQANETHDRFIVTYRNDSTERNNSNAALQNVKAAISRAGLDNAGNASNGATVAPLTASHQRKLAVGSDLIRTSRKLSQNEANKLMLQIASDPAVAHVQPDFRMQAVKDFRAPATLQAQVSTTRQSNTNANGLQPQAFTPDDPMYANNQWHFFNPAGGANINNAWDLADGADITVAVIDTGITEHPDLDTSLADAGYDFISDAFTSGRETDDRAPGGWDTGDWTNTAPWNDPMMGCVAAGDTGEPSSWHGTHVSGTVAELTDNGEGMAGVAYKAKVLPVRALGHCGGFNSDISDAIVWASGGHVDGVPDNTHPAQVINMSLGGAGACSPEGPEARAIADAISRGTTVVVSAGNSAADVANFTPASCPGVIAVASNGITGKRAFYSNYGQGITLSAPGGGIYADDGSSGDVVHDGFVFSAMNDGATVPGEPTYLGNAGTSMASPHVAGIVALVMGATKQAGLPTPSPVAIKDILTRSARAFPVAVDRPIGAGIVDAEAAVKLALNDDDGGGNDNATPLTKGVLLSGQNPSANGNLYSIVVPAGATTLNIRTLGGSGNVTLYVKAGSAPSADGSNADFTSSKPGTSQAVVIQQPQTATYYVRVSPQPGNNFRNISVLADYKP